MTAFLVIGAFLLVVYSIVVGVYGLAKLIVFTLFSTTGRNPTDSQELGHIRIEFHIADDGGSDEPPAAPPSPWERRNRVFSRN